MYQQRAQNPHRRRHATGIKPQGRFLLTAGVIGFLGIWFLTPVSDLIAQIVLQMVPVESDIELGRKAWAEMNYREVPDSWGVEKLGNQLVQLRRSNGDKIPWNFGVIRSDDVNAFALPGGIIRVTDKLLRELHLTEAELAALLGHEIGHVLKRHSQQQLLQEQMIAYLFQAITYEDGDDYQETFGEAIGELFLNGASFLGKQSFSRSNEYEADATAWELLADSAKYSPKAVSGLLQKLWDLSGGSGETSWESTHPGTRDRIDALRVQWESLEPRERRRMQRLQH